MADLIKWANDNDGFGMLLLTGVYVIATIIIARFNWRANRLSAKNIEQSLEIERMRSRPYLIFDVEHRSSMVFAILKNIGQTAANNVSLTVSPDLGGRLGNQDFRRIALAAKTISFIAPGRELADLVAVGHEFYSHYADPKFSAKLTYQDSGGAHYSEQFLIDLTTLKETIGIAEPSVPKELEKLAKEIRDISKNFERTRRSLEKLVESRALSANPESAGNPTRPES